jgi:hypothetical protein
VRALLEPRLALAAAAALLGAVALGGPPPASAGEPPPADPALAREIYVPRADWDQVIAREGRGIFVRYRELLELHRRAELLGAAEAPPLPAAIESARFRGTYADGAAHFEGTYRVRVLGPAARPPAVPPPAGDARRAAEAAAAAAAIIPARPPPEVVEVPLDLGGAGGSEATLDGAPAPLKLLEDGRLAAVLPATPSTRTLVVRFSIAAARRGAEREIAFGVAPAAAARLELEIPDALAATADPPLLERERLPDGGARIALSCGGARRIAITLRPRDEGRPAAPYTTVEQIAYTRLSDGAARTWATLRFDVARAPLPAIVVELPEGATLLDVHAPDLLRFRLEGRRLEVERARPNEGTFEVAIGLARVNGGGAVIPLRAIVVPGAARASGLVVIDPAPGVLPRIVAAEGLEELPASLSGVLQPGVPRAGPREEPRGRRPPSRLPTPAHPVRVFAHADPAYRLDVRPDPLPARASATVLEVVTLEDREAVVRASFATAVAEGRLFRLALALPGGLEVSDVKIDRPEGTYDRRIVEEDGARRLEVELRTPAARGTDVRVAVTGRRPYDAGAELRGVTSLALPLVTPLGFERLEGTLAVGVDPAYRLSAEAMSGLEAIDAALVPPDLAAFGPVALAFRIVGEPIRASTLVRREPPRADATVLSHVSVAAGRISVRQELILEVSRAPVDSVTLLAPPGAGGRVHVEGPAVKEQAVEPAGAEGDRIRVRLQGELRGTIRLFADAEARIEEWVPTGSADALIPLVRVAGVAHDEGAIVVLAGDATEVVPRPRDLETVDATEVPVPSRGPAEGRLVSAYRSALPTRGLALSLTRREDQPLLTAAVASSDVTTAVDPLGRSRTRARFDVRNARNQSIGVRLPSGSSLLSVLVDGEGAKPARASGAAGGGELFLVPVDEARLGKEALALEVVYEAPHAPWVDERGRPGGGRYEAAAPVVVVGAAEVPVLASALELRLPPGFAYHGFGGTAAREGVRVEGPEFFRWLARRPERLLALAVIAFAGALALAGLRVLAVRFGALRVGVAALGVALLGTCVATCLVTAPVRRGAYDGGRVWAPAPSEPAGAATGAAAPEAAFDKDARDEIGRVSRERERRPAAPTPPGAAPPPARPPADGAEREERKAGLEPGDRAAGADAAKTVAGKPALPGGAEAGLRSLAIALPGAPRVERFRMPVFGPATVTVDFAGADDEAGSAAFWALAGLLLGLLGARQRRGAEAAFFALFIAAATLGGAALGAGYATAVDGLTAGIAGAALARACAHLAAKARPWIEGRRAGAPPAPAPGAFALLAVAILAASGAAGGTAFAQETERGAPLTPPPGARVYVPYDPAYPSRVGPEGEVFVPLSDFERLWERAHGAPLSAPPRPDASWVAGARYEGRVLPDRAEVDAVLLVVRPRAAAARVPLGLSGAAIESAAIAGKPAILEPSEGGVAVIVEPPAPAAPALAEVRVRLRVPLAERRASLTLARAPVARARLLLEAPGYDLHVPSARGAVREDPGAGGTRVVTADLGGADRLDLALVAEPGRGEAAPGAPVEAKAETETTVRMAARHASIHVAAVVRVARGSLDRVRLALPSGVEPVTVAGPAIRAWRVSGEGEARTVEAVAYEPATSLVVAVTAEAPLAPTGRAIFLGLPVRDVAQERGALAVLHPRGEKPVVVRRTGLVQVDAGAGPAGARAPGAEMALLAAFRFTGRPAELEVERPALRERVTAGLDLRVAVEERRVVAEAALRLRPEGRPLFEAVLRLPSGYALESVAAAGGAETLEPPAAPGGPRTLRLRFPEGRSESTDIALRYARPRPREEATLDLPFVEVEAERTEGTALVLAAPDVEVGVLEASGLDVVDPARLSAGGLAAAGAPRLAWRFGAAGAPRARLSTRPLASEVSATVVVATTLHPDLVECDARIVLEARRSGLERITVELPAWVGDGASFAAEGLREVSSVEAPSTRFADGRARAYALTFQRAFTGRRAVDLFFERTEAMGGAGAAPPAVELPAAFVREATSGRVFLLAQSDGRANVRLEEDAVAGAERAARDDLPVAALGAIPGGGDFAYAYLVRGTARVAVRRVALAARERIEAIIDTADILTVVDASGVERTRARYSVQNRSEQFLEVRLPDGATLWSSFVADEPAKPVRKPAPDGERTLVPLPKRGKGELSFDVELVYERRGGGAPGLLSRTAPAAPAVLNMRVSETFWTLRVPEETRVFSIDGNMEETLEAVKERQRFEKAVEELKGLADLYRSGNEAERRNVAMNWQAQYARVEEQRLRAEAVQSEDASRLALEETTKQQKFQADLSSNQAAIDALNRRQAALLNELQAAQTRVPPQRDLAQREESRRGKRAYEERRALEDANKAAEVAQEQVRMEQAGQGASDDRGEYLGIAQRALVAPGLDARKLKEDAAAEPAGPEPVAEGSAAEPQPREGAPAASRAGEVPSAPVEVGDAGRTAPVPGGGAGGFRRGQVAQGPAGERQRGRPPVGGARLDADLAGRQGAAGLVAGDKQGRAFDAGRLSLRLPIPEVGRALHFRKSGGDPEIRFRASRLEVPGAATLLRLLALALLLLAARASGIARGGEEGAEPAGALRRLLRALGAIALVLLGLVASHGALGAGVACVALGAAWIALRGRGR